ncbi:MAG: hypothetical protein NTV46_10575 [Verrucomicrobia bacterium]|nr:hypothetical protein [Verrucomicrobiota bacterium]
MHPLFFLRFLRSLSANSRHCLRALRAGLWAVTLGVMLLTPAAMAQVCPGADC